MILDTASTPSRGWHGTLSAPLTMDVATYLQYFDLPVPGAHLERLGMMAREVIGTLLNQPTRPWGLVTDLAAAFETSRQTLYTIAARVRAGILVRPTGRRSAELKVPEAPTVSAYPRITVTPNRVQRTVPKTMRHGWPSGSRPTTKPSGWST